MVLALPDLEQVEVLRVAGLLKLEVHVQEFAGY